MVESLLLMKTVAGSILAYSHSFIFLMTLCQIVWQMERTSCGVLPVKIREGRCESPELPRINTILKFWSIYKSLYISLWTLFIVRRHWVGGRESVSGWKGCGFKSLLPIFCKLKIESFAITWFSFGIWLNDNIATIHCHINGCCYHNEINIWYSIERKDLSKPWNSVAKQKQMKSL